jgi:asparagine synthase (glutamine-hydrolysing)
VCGIVGILGRQEPEWIQRMNDAIQHRGPDGEGVFQEGDVSLAMRRLAIIDIGGGNQPMISVDGRFVLVYNGEIYNAGELRRQLEREGAVFVSDHSDTEVLLRLLIQRGADALPALNGMFAFAFYDRCEGTLLCARDRMGIKPFYYACADGRLVIASELKALLELPFFAREPDLQSLYHYFSLMYVPGQATALAGVSRLPPGRRRSRDRLLVGADIFRLRERQSPSDRRGGALGNRRCRRALVDRRCAGGLPALRRSRLLGDCRLAGRQGPRRQDLHRRLRRSRRGGLGRA